ncbi:MAG: hypothetical protein HQM16_08745 [Deltaproteobacteria bacterium]|nr:hypothetical protein [Deltaproteobacteria bacterium]
MKDVFRDNALSYIPKILQLCDRNPFHDTYGCFDRSFWHYKTMDFPSGMYQEYVLPLALVYQYNFDLDTVWYQNPRIRELCLAGIQYAARSSRADGSCDDYYPYERALGAMAFSLYAATESCLVLNHQSEEFLTFFKKRADYFLRHDESGKLSNHQALIALSLTNVWMLTNETKYLQEAKRRIQKVLSWQNDEGWFWEYEGCDLGYLTATISFLSQVYKKHNDPQLGAAVQKAIHFASHFIQRDGSFGGEYGSRNTYHYYPYGFELMSDTTPVGTAMNTHYAGGIINGKRHCNSDDRIFCHLVYDYLQACLAWSTTRQNHDSLPWPRSMYFKNAGLFVANTKNYKAIVACHKGGAVKASNQKQCFLSDIGPIGESRSGKVFVSNIYNRDNRVQEHENSIEIEADFFVTRDKTFTPLKQIIFRLANLTVARWSSGLFRSILQRILILGKKRFPGRTIRTLLFLPDQIKMTDHMSIDRTKETVQRLAFGPDHTSIYTAAANSYQESVLYPWVFLGKEIEEINQQGQVTITRTIGEK